MTPLRRMGRLIAATATTALTLGLAPIAAAQDVVEFSVSNITDFHGHLEEDDYNGYMGAALLAGLNDDINGEENVFTTSGDNVGGSAFVSAISNDEYTLRALNAAGVEVSAVGNHEFDKGQDDLQDRIVPASEYPILGANVYRADGTHLLAPHSIIEHDGVRIAFVGTVTQQTVNKVSPAGIVGLDFRDPVAETNRMAQNLKDNDEADVVISLMHEDAGRFIDGCRPGYVDFVFGGDSHVISAGQDAAVPYAQSGEYGQLLTDVDFTFDRVSGAVSVEEITQYDRDDAVALGTTPDAAVAKIVEEAKARSDVLGGEVVADLQYSFFRGSDLSGPGNNRGTESTLNHLIAEARRASMEEFTGEPVDVGFMNAGGVRAELPAGPVTYEDIYTIQPFGNEVSYATLSGQAIIDTIENQWKDPAESRPRLALGLSDNVSYVYDPTAPRGERVLDVTVDGGSIDPAADYRVAASTFLFEGGDGLIPVEQVRDRVNVGYMDVQAFIDHLEANPGVAPRAAQGDIGVSVDGELVAGETVTVNLTSLNYSNASEPQAQTVTVALGDVEVTTPITTVFTEEYNRYGEYGTATVDLTVPGDYDGGGLVVSTDAGTRMTVPAEQALEPAGSGFPGSAESLLVPVGSSF